MGHQFRKRLKLGLFLIASRAPFITGCCSSKIGQIVSVRYCKSACFTMSNQVDDAVRVYEEFSTFPSVKSGCFANKDTPGHLQVTSTWSQRDLQRKENVVFNRSHLVQLDVVIATPPQEVSNVQWNVEAPSGQYRAVVRKVPQKQGEDQQFIEIWSDKNKLHNISVQSLDQHGKIYEDATFGCLEWSHSETHILYIAEKKRPKGTSYFDPKTTSGGVDKDTDKEAKGDEFVYHDDWGEQLTGKSHSVVCVLDVESGSVSLLENMPEDVSAGSAVWCPDDLGILCVGTYHGPYRLGLIYCPMRRSAVFHIDLKTYKCVVVSKNDCSVSSPVFSPDSSKFLFLENKTGGPHNQCRKLIMCDWSTKGLVTVQDLVSHSAGPDDFPGLFTLKLHRRCWASDNRRIIVESQWRSKQELLVIDCETGGVTRLTNDDSVGCWHLLDVKDDIILATCSSPIQPQYLVIGNLPASGDERKIKWKHLDDEVKPIDMMKWSIHQMPVPEERINPDFAAVNNYEYICLEPERKKPETKLPLVVFPHGGPHSAFSSEMMLYTACLCRLGFIIVSVNYRGSIGFGEDCVESLPGQVGTQDVQDVQAVAEHAFTAHNADPDRVVVMGGSHGGFLVTHLIGQYPDFYKAALARNPVTNIASMSGSTDITDWTNVEAGLRDFTFSKVATPEFYTQCWNVSPIKYVDKVKTPILLCVGLNDRRVPPKQANEYRKALVARGVPVRMLCYPDNSHPIIKVDSEADCFINAFKWFTDHLCAAKWL